MRVLLTTVLVALHRQPASFPGFDTQVQIPLDSASHPEVLRPLADMFCTGTPGRPKKLRTKQVAYTAWSCWVCGSMSTYVCTVCVFMHVDRYVGMHVCMYVHASRGMHGWMDGCMDVCVHIMCMHVYMYVCMSVGMYE